MIKFKLSKNRIKMNAYLVLLLSVVFASGLVSIYFYQTKKAFSDLPRTESIEYKNHYAFISADVNDSFYNSVFEAAKSEGSKRGDYVEYFGKDLSTDYTREELLEIAIAAKVDGIFLEADESKEISELINTAVDKGIPVITMGNDCTASTRQSFVGVNNFSLGQEYGQQLLKISKGKPENVLVLMNANSADTSQNIVFGAIKEQIEKNNREDIALKTIAVADDSAFSVEESIRDIITKEYRSAKILVCLSESNTGAAYQALVDYNRVGNVEILGFHKNEQIIEGIAQKNIFATFEVDTDQMGRYLIEAIDEYKEYGYVNEYMTVDVNIINEDNVEGYIDEME